MQIVIGTRGSKLALAQADAVRKRLEVAYPDDTFVLKVIKTTGDRIADKPLNQIGDKGLFVKEIERELLCGSIQMAVHSMKDMPSELPRGLCFANFWEREDPRDVLILRSAESLDRLPAHAVIGTGSRRRAYQLLMLRPDLNIVDIRGNVDTRLKKLESLHMDGIVLAAAGLHRLGKEDVITQYLEPEQMVPAVAQGTLAIEVRGDEKALLDKLNRLSDANTQRCTETERSFLKEVGGDCHLPVGAYASVLPNGKIQLQTVYGDAEGRRIRKASVTGDKPSDIAQEAVKIIRGA